MIDAPTDNRIASITPPVDAETLRLAMDALREKQERDAKANAARAEAADFERRIAAFQSDLAALEKKHGVRMIYQCAPPQEVAQGVFAIDCTKIHVGYAPLK